VNNTTGIYFKAQFKIFLVLLNKQQYHSAFEINVFPLTGSLLREAVHDKTKYMLK